MHELSIALSLVEVAGETLAQHPGARVEAVHLRLGPLSGVVKQALLSAYELASENSVLAGSRLLIVDVPLVVHCAACAADRTLAGPQDMSCPVCGTPASQVVRGRELEVVAMEIADEIPASAR